MKKTSYDLAFGLGLACSCSETLRAAKLQYLSFPYDWIAPISIDLAVRDQDIVSRAEQIVDHFSTWFQHDDFTYVQHLPQFGKDLYHCDRLCLAFNHDFLPNVPYDTMFPKVVEKYRRRCDRLVSLIKASRRVLILHVDRPDLPGPLSASAAQQAQAILQKAFPKAQFDLYLLSYEKGRPVTECRMEQIGKGITRASFDYRDSTPGAGPHQINLHMTGDFLSARFKVRDYRTSAEKRHFNEVKWAKRCQSAGVASRQEFYKAQITRHLNGRFNVVANLIARLRRRKFEQMAILGFNCETAFRFVQKWDFLDSSVFAWTNTGNLANLVHALTIFNRIGTGEMKFEPRSRMWLCTESQVYFHGRMRAQKGDALPSQEAIDKDLADLHGRLNHLKEKFLTYLRNEQSILLVYKLNPDDAANPQLDALFTQLDSALKSLGARNCTLLTVCEKRARPHMPPETANRFFRSVARYNPGSDATNRHTGDPGEWNRIFSEFAPAHVLKQEHHFKYE